MIRQYGPRSAPFGFIDFSTWTPGWNICAEWKNTRWASIWAGPWNHLMDHVIAVCPQWVREEKNNDTAAGMAIIQAWAGAPPLNRASYGNWRLAQIYLGTIFRRGHAKVYFEEVIANNRDVNIYRLVWDLPLLQAIGLANPPSPEEVLCAPVYPMGNRPCVHSCLYAYALGFSPQSIARMIGIDEEAVWLDLARYLAWLMEQRAFSRWAISAYLGQEYGKIRKEDEALIDAYIIRGYPDLQEPRMMVEPTMGVHIQPWATAWDLEMARYVAAQMDVVYAEKLRKRAEHKRTLEWQGKLIGR